MDFSRVLANFQTFQGLSERCLNRHFQYTTVERTRANLGYVAKQPLVRKPRDHSIYDEGFSPCQLLLVAAKKMLKGAQSNL